MPGKRSQDDREAFEIDEVRFECLGPWLHGSIEDGPGLQCVMALKANAGEVAGCAVEAVATHYPAGLDLVAIAVALDVREDVIVRGDGQPGQAGGSTYLTTVLLEVAAKNVLCGLFGDPDIEAVDAAATTQVDRAQKLAAGVDFDHALPASGNEKFVDQPHRLEDLQGARVDHGRSIPVERRSLRID